ncbi:hypothetical protein D9615_005822 [Tricholomella constricta]|uniref:SAM domain-containing protein n=1 Tax=Tricholomella constricta TaxID=117010 RepID=A0A8H5HAQ8_9AGAR|nr:hypothetical protein D9615_005822 [Tricholomella constricta]
MSVPSSSRPSSPTKPGVALPEGLKANPHPYAIKTTSTGILSRSATTSSSVSLSHNHYVPVSPSPSPTKASHRGHSERGSRHRYSRSLTDDIPRPLPVPPEELYYQQKPAPGHTRSRADTLPAELSDSNANPKSWTPEQLAANVPEIAEFVKEHEITGRAFLRFDEGVLDAYGVSQQWQRSLLLAASRQLRKSVLNDRIWPQHSFETTDLGTTSGRLSVSPSKSRPLPLPNDEDEAYLSSSSISSASSLSGRRKRRYRPNGRVHGMVASFERSSSVDEGHGVRERSGSTSSVDSFDEPYFQQPQSTGNEHLLPFPPPSGGPLLLPTSSFPPSLSSPFNTPQATGNGNGMLHTTPHATGNGNTYRPLPSLPSHPSLRSAPTLTNEDEQRVNQATDAKNMSGEMTMDDLIAVLNADAVADGSVPADAFVNTSRREKDRGKKKGRKAVEGAAAWEMDFGLGETVKRAPPVPPPPTLAHTQRSQVVEEELSVEELLALEGGVGVGTAALVDEPVMGLTMKHVEEDDAFAGGLGRSQQRFDSISRGTSKGAQRISLSAGRVTQGQGKKQARRVGELFSFADADGIGEGLSPEEVQQMEREQAMRRAEESERLRHDAEYAKAEWQQEADKERARLETEEMARKLQLAEAEVQELREAQAQKQPTQAENDIAKRRREEQEQLEEHLASSIEENRRLLNVLQGRLEEVERRVEDLEAASLQPEIILKAHVERGTSMNEGKETDPKTCVVRRLRVLAVWALSTPLGAVIPAAIGVPLAKFLAAPANEGAPAGTNEANTDASPTRRRRGDRDAVIQTLYPKSVRRYALLLGIGMCAIMLRGLMRWGVKGMRGVGVVGTRGVRKQ